MNNTQLRTFVSKALENKRVTFGDVKRLQRDILPEGILNREDAEILIALDQALQRKDASWTGYLVSVIVDYAVWGSRPTGYIDPETAQWLVSWLSCEKPTKATVRIANELVSEAQDIDAALLAFVRAIPIPPGTSTGPDTQRPIQAS
jgi:hypothetical protein